MYSLSTICITLLPAVLGRIYHQDKRGVGWAISEKQLAPVTQFFTADSRIRWYFDWNKCVERRAEDAFFKADRLQVGDPAIGNGAAFIPLVWTVRTLYEATHFQEGYKAVMGSNEPGKKDQTIEGTSEYVDPGVAATEWQAMVEKIKTEEPSRFANKEIKLVSPAPANDIDWLERFFTSLCGDPGANNNWIPCTNYADPPEFVAVHAYFNTWPEIEAKMNRFWTRFGRHLMVSEFACTSLKAPYPDLEAVTACMKQGVAMLEQTEWIWKYAWFGASRSEWGLQGAGPNVRLIDTDGKITPLGELYKSLPIVSGPNRL